MRGYYRKTKFVATVGQRGRAHADPDDAISDALADGEALDTIQLRQVE